MDPVQPGEQFLTLFQQMGATIPEAVSEDEFSAVRSLIKERVEYDSAGFIDGFLRHVLRREKYDARGFIVHSVQQFLACQRTGALASQPTDCPLFEFAYWDGETGGDCWCVDFGTDAIRCIQAGFGDAPLQDVRAESYGVFKDAEWFVIFLAGIAQRNDWLTKS